MPGTTTGSTDTPVNTTQKSNPQRPSVIRKINKDNFY